MSISQKYYELLTTELECQYTILEQEKKIRADHTHPDLIKMYNKSIANINEHIMSIELILATLYVDGKFLHEDDVFHHIICKHAIKYMEFVMRCIDVKDAQKNLIKIYLNHLYIINQLIKFPEQVQWSYDILKNYKA